MTSQTLKALDRRLQDFLEELTEPMGRSERRHWARVYLEGLLLAGERKSIEPMAARVAGADVQALRQFVGQSPWEVEEIERRLALKVVDLLSEPEVWILDETAFPKAGEHSVGVARQYCGTLGKVANCQVAVSLHWSSAEASCPILWRLYLPKQWLEDTARAAEVKLPPGTSYHSKTELALEAIDQAVGWELPRLPVVADSFYGNDFGFRQALRERGLPYAVQVEPTTVIWNEDPHRPLPAPKQKGRPRKYPPLEALPQPQDLRALAEQLPRSAWRTVAWRQGTRGMQRSRFAMIPVWAAHGWRKQEHPPRVVESLLVEWPQGSPQPTKYWLAHLGSQPPGLRRLVRIAKARWRVELDYRELKEELGLDHYEGRQWLGWHHHVCLVSIAYAFLRSEQARLKKNFWCDLADGEEEAANHSH
ncbi:MAG: IS701 family transposase [Acidobacteria bacterium]|nr:IS701 family transposase [Acidobacteriota bacterium]